MEDDDENSFAFVLHDVARMLRYRFDVKARALGVTRSQWRLLITLARQPGETQARLADLIEVERITLCRMVDRLEASGLAERRPDPADRRAWRIFLTPRGEKMMVDLRVIGDQVHDETMAALTAEEESQLTAMMIRLRDLLFRRTQAMAEGAATEEATAES